MRVLVAIAAVSLGACGPGLEPEMAGTWEGLLSVDAPNRNVVAPSLRLGLTVEGDRVDVAGLCPLGDGEAQLVGVGAAAAWDGVLVCAAFQDGGCQETLTYRKLELAHAGDFLFLDGTGTLEACGVTADVLMSFVGVRP